MNSTFSTCTFSNMHDSDLPSLQPYFPPSHHPSFLPSFLGTNLSTFRIISTQISIPHLLPPCWRSQYALYVQGLIGRVNGLFILWPQNGKSMECRKSLPESYNKAIKQLTPLTTAAQRSHRPSLTQTHDQRVDGNKMIPKCNLNIFSLNIKVGHHAISATIYFVCIFSA